MKVARFVLKVVTAGLAAAAVVCAVIAYWDKITDWCTCAKNKIQAKTVCASEYEDYEE